MFTLYDYYRSSASYRVRIALNLKDIAYETIPINLIKRVGEHHGEQFAEYQNINPQALVPTLKCEDGTLICQSLNIIEFLESVRPTPNLIPHDPLLKSKVKQIAYAISCDIHPLNNLRVLNYLTQKLKHNEDEKQAWYKHWIMDGFYAVEDWLKDFKSNQKFCVGDTPTLADCCLIPQVYNAERFRVSLDNYPIIKSIYDNCLEHAAFIQAHPDNCRQ